MQKGKDSKAKSACRPASGKLAVFSAGFFLHQSCKSEKPFIHPFYHRSIRSLLRPEHRRASVFSTERIVHIAGCQKTYVRKPGIHSAFINGYHAHHILSEHSALFSALIQETHSQRLQHSHSAIVGRTASEPQNHLPTAFVQSRQNHFSHTKTCGILRVSFLLQNKRKTCCLRHFYHSQLLFFYKSILRSDRSSERTCHRDFFSGNFFSFPLFGIKKGVHRSLSAIRYGTHRHIGARHRILHGLFDNFPCFP